ncbi:hypothetical protein H1R20_g759, partial [Candolleomyces eurysporus]
MGPGSHRDTLDDNFGDHNWAKITNFAPTFKDRGKEAIEMRKQQVGRFLDYSASLSATPVNTWTEEVQAWEEDDSKPNPFIDPSVITEHSIRFELAKEDTNAVKQGEAILLHKDSSPSLMVFQGIQVEKMQRDWKIKLKELGDHSTDLAWANFEEAGHALLRRIDAWKLTQHLYLPQVAAIWKVDEEDGNQVEYGVEDILLLLPLALAATPGIDLHFFQLWNSKKKYSQSQGQNTHSHAFINSVQQKIDEAIKMYRYIHQCMQKLGGALGTSLWEAEFPVLQDEDVWGLSDDMEAHGGGQGIQGIDVDMDNSGCW